MTPYFYIVKHKVSGKQYAGVSFGKASDPSTFMTKKGYTTSSKDVNAIIASEGIDAFEVARLDTEGDVLAKETEFLRENDCAGDPMWFNKHNNTAPNFASEEFKQKSKNTLLLKYGVANAMDIPEVKEKVAAAMRGNDYGCFKRSDETKARISQYQRGRSKSAEQKKKQAIAMTGRVASEDTRKKMSERRIGKKQPPSFSIKMSAFMAGEGNPMFGKVSPMRGKKFPTITCEHCGKEASKGNYLRWHGNNCKQAAFA